MPQDSAERKADLELLDHGWKHFTFHAQQRLSLFNFYVVFCGLLAAAWATVMTSDEIMPIVGVVLSLLLSLVSYVFWRLDQRNAYLTKEAERVIEKAEDRLFGDDSNLFCVEMIDAPLGKAHHLATKYWSFGTSLRLIFIAVGLIGIAGAADSWVMGREPTNQVETPAPTETLPDERSSSPPMEPRLPPPKHQGSGVTNNAVTK